MSSNRGTTAERRSGRRGRRARLAAAACCALSVLMPMGVQAQERGDPGESAGGGGGGGGGGGDGLVISDKPALFVTFGISNLGPMRSSGDTWLPVTLAVQGGVQPFEGIVRASFQQDATQAASVVTPVAATPGKISEFRIALPLPSTCTRIEFALIDRSGRTVQTSEYSQTPTRNQMQLPPLYTTADLSVLGIGAPGGPASSVSVLGTATAAQKGGAARTALIAPDRMPTSWAGLDSTGLVVVEADMAPRLDPRAMAALHEWVSGGGRLVVLTDKAGVEWRAWLPPAPAAGVVNVEEPSSGPVPSDLAEVVRVKPIGPISVMDNFADQQSQQVYLPPNWAGPLPGPREAPRRPTPPEQKEPDAESLRASDRAPQRVIRLTPQGEHLGWRVRWTGQVEMSDAATAPAVDEQRLAGASGLLAEGPVGFGWVAIVGIDPRKASAIVSARTTLAVWESVISPVRAHLGGRLTANANNYYGYSYARGDLANNLVLDELSDVPTVGHIAFAAIAAAMVGLALMLGPVDAFVLGRLRKRHRSWATALVWITLAALAAYQAPLLGRSSISVVNRASVIDAIIPAGATVTPASELGGSTRATLGPGAAAPLAWQTSLTGVFAGASVLATFDGGRQRASYWRGTSAIDFYGQEQRLSSAEVPLVQTLPSLGGMVAGGGGIDPWGGWMPTVEGASAAGGSPVANIPLGLWTFRTFQDRVRTLPPCDVKILRAPDGLGVQVTGLPPDAVIATACLRVGRGWHALSFDPERGADLRRAALGASLSDAPAPWKLTELENPWYYYQQDGTGRRRLARNPMLVFTLPGPDARGAAVDSLVASGNWACAYLLIENLPVDVVLSTPAKHRRSAVCRILIPLPASDPPASSDSPSAPPNSPTPESVPEQPK